MRGKVRVGEAYSRAYRITPAYAGKSSAFVRNFRLCKDHPRLCGEKERNIQHSGRNQGSPPPMRGKAVIDYATSVIWGITPAYAGKSNISCL